MDADRTTTGSQRTIGPYRIERELGRGGMGIVYLGRDTRLDRPVALKSLSEELAQDPERLARFEREARILASLDHPSIGAIHGIEVAEGRRYLALEYVEGVTLADRLAGGPLPIDDTIEIGIQLAAGIEAAHEASVIHRDLKPANIMLGRDDRVKILDFGLAKGRVATESDVDLGDSPAPAGAPPTRGSAVTVPGVILGTAAYLSPEQAKGRPVDRRTDIWSFGCTLYECLSGQRAFRGETAAEAIAQILERDPDWTALSAATPPALRGLIQHCLEKDPRHRLRDIGDARIALEELRAERAASRSAAAHGATAEEAGPLMEPGRRPATRWILLAAALGMVAGAAIWSALGPRRDGASSFRGVARLSIEVPPELHLVSAVLSPDGRTLAIVARPRATGAEGEAQGTPALGVPAPTLLYVRPMDATEFVPVGGTEGVTGPLAFSPDGRWIAFLAPLTPGAADLRLMKIATRGKLPAMEISAWSPDWMGLVWPRAGELLTQAGPRSFVRIPAGGGPPSGPIPYQFAESTLSTVPTSTVPGVGAVLLQSSIYKEGAWRSGTAVLEPRSGRVRLLLRDGGSARVTPTGHLVFSRSDVLLAAPLDSRRLELSGPPVAILKGLRTASSWQPAAFGLGSDGTLVYAPGGVVSRNRRPVVVDPRGAVGGWPGEGQEYAYGVAVSRDGRRLAAPIPNAKLLTEIWISDRATSTLRRAISVPGADLAEPVWSPDGRRIAFALAEMTERDGVYIADVDGGGAPRPVYLPRNGFPVPATPTSWSRDGSTLLVSSRRPGYSDVIAVQVGGAARAGGSDSLPPSRVVLTGPGVRADAVFSPDGRRIAYVSGESGRNEIYVAAWLPDGSLGPSVAVSLGGGTQPHWSADGRALYYVAPPGRLMSVAPPRAPGLPAPPPRLAWDLDALRVGTSQLFDARLFDLLPDGRLLAVQQGPEEGEVADLDVVLNFFDEVRGGARAR